MDVKQQSTATRDNAVFGHIICEFPQEKKLFGQPLAHVLDMHIPRQLLVNHEPEQHHSALRAFNQVTAKGAHQILCFGFI